MSAVTADEAWLAANWPFVRDQLPAGPASVLEVGCGPCGGFVPALLQAGYGAVGIDPQAPEGVDYERVEFESYEPARQVDAVVACVSLHHVGRLDEVLAKIDDALTSWGTLVVVEWDWQRFDAAAAQWCFARLSPAPAEAEHGWLHRHREKWAASYEAWEVYLRRWADTEGLHTGEQILGALDARFDRLSCAEVPYFYPELAGTGESDEQAAIDAGQIQANGIRYVGRVGASAR